jgi:hypothetical protein
MVTRVKTATAESGVARGVPTWLLVLVTLGVWVGVLRTEIVLVPEAARDAAARGEAVGGLRELLFSVGVWLVEYWWLFPWPMLSLLAGLALARSLAADGVLRRRLALVWFFALVLPSAVLALVSLAVCYRL